MIKKTCSVAFTLLLLYQTGFCQTKSSNPPVTIIFDSAGRIIQFPPAVIRRKVDVAFKVKVSINYLNKQTDQLAKYLTAEKKGLSDKEVDMAYKCLFGNDYTSYLQELDGAINLLQNNYPLSNYETVLKNAKDNHIPVYTFLDKQLRQQFQVRISNGPIELQTLNLVMTSIDANGKYVYFESADIFNSSKFKDVLNGSSTPADEYKFQLLRHDPWNETLISWFNDELKKITTAVDNNTFNAKDYNSALSKIDDDDLNVFNTSLAYVRHLNDWYINWLWFTKGQLSLTPLNVLKGDEIESLAAIIADKKALIIRLQQQKDFIDSSIARLRAVDRNLTRLTDLQNEASTRANSIKTETDALNTLNKQYTASTTLLSALATIPLLYTGELYTSGARYVNVMKQFDAARNYRPVYRYIHPFFPSRWSKERVTEVPEDEHVILMVQNTPAGTKLTIDEKRWDFDDTEEFTKQVKDNLASIDFTSLLSTTGLTSLTDLTRGLVNKGVPESIRGGIIPAKILDCGVGSTLQKMLAKMRDASDSYSLPFDQKAIEAEVSSTADFSATIQQAALDKYQAPFTDSVNIRDVTKPDAGKDVAKSYIRVGGLRYVELAAGVSFVRTPTPTTSIDTAGNGFKVSSSDNASNAIVGFKIYPFRDYRRDKGLIPRYPFRRLSIFGGFDMLKPLNDFYIGGAYDIVPGLTFIVGRDYYKQTTYTVANNQVTDTKHRYANGGLFYSVTVNPILFVQIIKTFFK